MATFTFKYSKKPVKKLDSAKKGFQLQKDGLVKSIILKFKSSEDENEYSGYFSFLSQSSTTQDKIFWFEEMAENIILLDKKAERLVCDFLVRMLCFSLLNLLFQLMIC